MSTAREDHRSSSGRAARTVIGETTAASVVVAAATVVFAVVAHGPRGALFFEDGDALVLALMRASREQGLPQDWVMSAVGFFPETALHDLLTPAVRSPRGALAVSGLLNVVLASVAFRVVAAAVGVPGRRRRVGSAVVAVGVVLAMAVTETSPDRGSAEIVSLVFATTYYGLSVVAVLLLVGLVGWCLRRGDSPWATSSAGAGIVAVLAVSSTSNPIVLAWAVAPLAVLLVVVMGVDLHRIRRSEVGRWTAVLTGPAARALLALLAGTAVGSLVRRTLSDRIGGSIGGIVAADRSAFPPLGSVVADRLRTPGGVVTAIVVLVLLIACVVLTHRAIRTGDRPAAVVAAFGWVAPITTTAGLVLLDVPYPRYLQPVVWAPVLAVVVAARVVSVPGGRTRPARLPRPGDRAFDVAAAVTTVVAVAAGVVAAPVLGERATTVSADVRCVADWIDASGRRGVGEFWAVRAVKLEIEDQRSLVQVDERMRAKAWMVNRADGAGLRRASFLVVGPESRAAAPPTVGGVAPVRRLHCGTLTVVDYGAPVLPVDSRTLR